MASNAKKPQTNTSASLRREGFGVGLKSEQDGWAGAPSPHNLTSERLVLWACLRADQFRGAKKEDAKRILSKLEPVLFYDLANGRVAQCICVLRDKGEVIDEETVLASLTDLGWLDKIGGASYLSRLLNAPGTRDVEAHFATVERHYKARRSIAKCHRHVSELYQLARNETRDHDAASEYDDLAVIRGKNNPEFDRAMLDFAEEAARVATNTGRPKGESARNLGIQLLARIDERQVSIRDGKPIEGTRTGMVTLDKVLGILRPGLSIVAAWSGVGKSSLARKWAMNIASASSARRGVLFFGAEMTNAESNEAMVHAIANVDSSKLDRGQCYTDEELVEITKAAAWVGDLPIHHEDSSTMGDKTPQTIESIYLQKKREWEAEGIQPAAIFVDYLQLFRPDVSVRNREQDMSNLAQSLHDLGQRVGIPVIALSQLNELGKERGDGRPCAEDLRESRGISNAAVTVVLVHNPEYMARRRVVAGTAADKEELVELIIDKGRKSPVGIVQVVFRPWCSAFVDYTEKKPDVEQSEEQHEGDGHDAYADDGVPGF